MQFRTKKRNVKKNYSKQNAISSGMKKFQVSLDSTQNCALLALKRYMGQADDSRDRSPR